MNSIVQHLQSQLMRLPPDRKLQYRGNQAWICCPWHGNGREHSPSLKINLAPPFLAHYFCFGCAAKGHWNDIAKHFKLKSLKKEDMAGSDLYVSTENVDSFLGEKEPEKIGGVPWDKDQDWRDIPGWLVAKLGGAIIINNYEQPMLRFPLQLNEKLLGWVDCKIVRQQGDDVAYINSKNLDKTQVLFPFNYVKKMIRKKKYAVLVEGPRDALWLVAHGIPALSILGSKTSWTDSKGDLLMSLFPKAVIMGFDNDDAGEGARKKASSYLKKQVPCFRLDYDEEDPAKIPASKLRHIARNLEAEISKL